MLNSHQINPPIAVEGMALAGYESRPMFLPMVAQETESVFTDSVVGNLGITVTDLDNGFAKTLTVALSTTTLATSLDEIVAAWQADPFFSAIATISEDGTDTVDRVFRVAGKRYSLAYTLPGAMAAPTVANTAEAIDADGSGIEFGRLVRRGSNDGEIATLTSGIAAGDIVGLIRRTEGNHFHKLQESITDVDATLRGKDYPIIRKGYIWVRTEDSVTPNSTPFGVITGSGEIGAFRSDADGGNAIDVSSFCEFVKSTTTATYGGVSLALLHINR